MKTKDVFLEDPTKRAILNDGVANVSAVEDRTLKYELQTFVCDGEYAKGLDLILQSYLGNIDKPEQPAVWVSGFYGCGKSHLVKVLRYLWTDFTLADKSTARGIVRVPSEIRDALKELSGRGRQNGGLHAAVGALDAGLSVPLGVLAVVFRSLDLPEDFPAARFVLWLRSRGIEDRVRNHLKKAGKTLERELRNMYVSTPLAAAVLEAEPKLADTPAAALVRFETNYPQVKDITIDQMLDTLRETLTRKGGLLCTAIILDEVQQYIADDSNRSYMVQEVVEALSKRFDGKVMVIGTGQASLSSTPLLARLRGRFTKPVQLSDVDVAMVIRKVVLEKRPDREGAILKVLEECKGEISRHLTGTKLAPRPEDDRILVSDYPLLPARQRFWSEVVRAVDQAGMSGQLRTQLRIAHDAAKELAEDQVGAVVPADFIYDQIATDMVQSAVLSRDLYQTIAKLKDGSKGDVLKGRICALIFLIGKLPKEAAVDLGVRANPGTLADLLVTDLTAGSADLRKKIPALLAELVESGLVMQVDDEYRIQTRESSDWERDFRLRYAKVSADEARIAQERAGLLKKAVSARIEDLKLLHGKCKEPRKVELTFTADPPEDKGPAVPIWVRNGWDDTEANVLAEARAKGVDSPLVTVFLPKRAPEDLKKAIARQMAAEDTIATRGQQTTPPGIEAMSNMETRTKEAKGNIEAIITLQVLSGARVFLAGGQEFAAGDLAANAAQAVEGALTRLFKEFARADYKNWDTVLKRAREGAANALEAIGYQGNVEQHPVCAELLAHVGQGKKGREVRAYFQENSYGWPKDAVDAALVILTGSGHIRAMMNGRPIDRAQLDQTKISGADFRIEATTVSANQRIALRALFSTIGVTCASGEESGASPKFLEAVRELAAHAGGDAPLPSPPDTLHVKALQDLTGNDQLVAIYNERERLQKEIESWRKTAEMAARRSPQWDSLQRLLAHAVGLGPASEVEAQAQAIERNRSLLSDPDPVPSLCGKLGETLRAEILRLQAACQETYEAESARLFGSAAWRALTEAQQTEVLGSNQITAIPNPALGSQEDLIDSLDSRSIERWKELRDALPSRFARAGTVVAKLLEPKAVRVDLPSATIRNEAELAQWLDEAKQAISESLKKGPVIV